VVEPFLLAAVEYMLDMSIRSEKVSKQEGLVGRGMHVVRSSIFFCAGERLDGPMMKVKKCLSVFSGLWSSTPRPIFPHLDCVSGFLSAGLTHFC